MLDDWNRFVSSEKVRRVLLKHKINPERMDIEDASRLMEAFIYRREGNLFNFSMLSALLGLPDMAEEFIANGNFLTLDMLKRKKKDADTVLLRAA